MEEFNVYQTLFKMDPNRYAQTIGDLASKKESYPIWADIDFLERGEQNAVTGTGKTTANNEIK